jgi:hypothetical protein
MKMQLKRVTVEHKTIEYIYFRLSDQASSIIFLCQYLMKFLLEMIDLDFSQ